MQPVPRPERPVGKDFTALKTVLWTRRGGGYSYASSSQHVASIVLRNVTGMEMQAYIDQTIANPICGGSWAMQRLVVVLPWRTLREEGTLRSVRQPAAVCVYALASRPLGQEAGCACGLRGNVPTPVAIPAARSIQAWCLR